MTDKKFSKFSVIRLNTKNLYLLAVPISLIFTAFADKILPPQYLRDSNYFTARIESRVSGYSDSFQQVVDVYKFLSIEKPTLWIRILEWLIFFTALLVVRSEKFNTGNSISADVLSICYLTFLPLYGSLFSKEFFVALFFLPTLFLLKYSTKQSSFIILLIFALVISILIRPYFIITFLSTIILYLLNNRKWITKFLTIVLSFAIISAIDSKLQLSNRFLGVNLFNLRNEINANVSIEANTKISQNQYTSNIFNNISIYLKVILDMVMPLKVLSLRLYSLAIFIASFIIAFCLNLAYFSKKYGKYPEASFLCAFFITSTIFEPDLGSFSRHGFLYILLVIRILYVQMQSIVLNINRAS